MKMFAAKEEKNLNYLLSKVTDDEFTPCLEQLHGLLFGLAIAPEVISSEVWLPLIYGDDPSFDDEFDAERCLGYLIIVYDRMVNERNRGKLTFPFNYDKMNEDEFALVDDWTYGLFMALSLKPNIWGISEDYLQSDIEKLPDDVIELMDAHSVITSIAVPEEMEEAFKEIMETESIDADELLDMLYGQLPFSVDILQKHGKQIREGKTSESLQPDPRKDVAKQKVGRNDDCPCGSGKKYKKCCGSN